MRTPWKDPPPSFQGQGSRAPRKAIHPFSWPRGPGKGPTTQPNHSRGWTFGNTVDPHPSPTVPCLDVVHPSIHPSIHSSVPFVPARGTWIASMDVERCLPRTCAPFVPIGTRPRAIIVRCLSLSKGEGRIPKPPRRPNARTRREKRNKACPRRDRKRATRCVRRDEGHPPRAAAIEGERRNGADASKDGVFSTGKAPERKHVGERDEFAERT